MMLEWDQTSLIWSVIANTVRDAKKTPKPHCPSIVHPFRDAEAYKSKPIQADITVLKQLLPKHGKSS